MERNDLCNIWPWLLHSQTPACCFCRPLYPLSCPHLSTRFWGAPSFSHPTSDPSSSGKETTSKRSCLFCAKFAVIYQTLSDFCVTCSWSYFAGWIIVKVLFRVFFASTKRVDHTNTRLSSQLERNPGECLPCFGTSFSWLYNEGGATFKTWCLSKYAQWRTRWIVNRSSTSSSFYG